MQAFYRYAPLILSGLGALVGLAGVYLDVVCSLRTLALDRGNRCSSRGWIYMRQADSEAEYKFPH